MGRTASGNIIVGALPIKASFSKGEKSAIKENRAANTALKKKAASKVRQQQSKRHSK